VILDRADCGTADTSTYSVPRQAGRAVLLTTIVTAALLAFPSAVPWMIAGWLLWHTVAAARGRPAWLPLLACLGILLTKRVYWPPSLFLLAVAMLIVAIVRAVRSRIGQRHMPGSWVTTSVLWAAWLLFILDWRMSVSSSRDMQLVDGRPVVCLGDSLTSGLLPEKGYPDVLAEMLTIPVVNLGQSGINAHAALELLPRVRDADPQILVLAIGGHDFLQGRSRAETRRGLKRLVESCRALGAEVVLMEMPRGFMIDPYSALEREIARQYDLQLISDSAIRRLVLWSPVSPPGIWSPASWHLSDDGIHPNRRGTRHLAETVAAALVNMYGPPIRRTATTEPVGAD
jgi:acyl-CoA thioesterase I